MTIAYHELDGSGKIGATRTGLRGERLFHVLNYGEREEFIVALMGQSFRVGTQVIYTAPARFDVGSALYCVSTEAVGIGVPEIGSTGHISYTEGAKVIAHYETLPYDPEDEGQTGENSQTFLSESLSITGQAIELAKKNASGAAAWEWDSNLPLGGTTGDTAPVVVKIVPQADYSMTRHKVPELPKTTIFGLIGKVNSATFGDCAAETLLFLGAECNREHTTDGTRAWEIVLQFMYNPNNHNKIFNPDTGLYEYVRSVADNTKRPYETASFSPLLTA